jgi:hypothetical protein
LALVTTVGGYPPQGTFTNSEDYLYLRARPRQAQVALTLGGVGTLAAQVGAIYDGGLFFGTPVPILSTTLLQPAATMTGQSTLTLTMGSRPDVCILQPAA